MELSGDVARKRGPADRLALEAAKTDAAARVAARSGSFHVPAVVRFDATAGVLETQRVHDFVSLMQLVVRRDPRLIAVCERVGRAVADVHADLRLPDALRIPLPAMLAGDPGDECVLHGDLNGSNVGYDPSTDRVVLVDWSAAPALGVAATVGSRYFDILWFALFFFRFRPGTALTGWSPERWAGAFLAGYADASGAFSAAKLRAYHERARAFLENDLRAEQARRGLGIRGLPYRVWRQLGFRRFERFLASLADPQTRRRAGEDIVPAGRHGVDGG
jgi:aminoglycoside phosphotransferase (APT) family kinase protein